jgi:hypothetical protein
VDFSRLVALALVACTAACKTTTTTSPPGLENAVVLRSHAVRAWDLMDGAVRAGSVVRFEEPGTAARAWFSVRNVHAQELGIVDVEGRAWRYRPHQRDPVWLGSGTVLTGASRILDAGPAAKMVEVPVSDIAARGSQGA